MEIVRDDTALSTTFLPRAGVARQVLADRHARKQLLLDQHAQFCLGTTTPFLWEEALWIKGENPLVHRAYSRSARSRNAAGLEEPRRLHEGLRVTIRFLGERDAFTRKQRSELGILALVLHARVDQLCREVTARTASLRLTKRERETLRWGALGKTSEDIADILGLTKRTVDQHFENAGKKLGTINRVQTVVKAYRHNLITL